ncbi:hypothetical protein [Rhizobium leguminosarum]|uniref:Uncharacterized protein n=1 Tax=Rhizobium leguminosarum TaxID=384 RepID=A0A1B1C3U8_RHILE|nr:hypothetical protein [Rhizobium leguminosarum]ANP84453.1 hypothetical protein BA011_00990 [Rhizobium leguminosarum]
MKKENFYRLRNLYPHLCCYDVMALPDGWTRVAERLLVELNAIQPHVDGVYGSPVPLKIQAYGGFAVAFATVNTLGGWDRDKAIALVEAIQRFNAGCNSTCEECGESSAMIVKEYDGSRQQRLCQHHAGERLRESYDRETLQ